MTRALYQPADHFGSSWPAILPPVITSPQDGASGLIVTLALALAVAPMRTVDGTDTLAATDWEIRTAPNGGGSVVWSSINNPLALLGITVPALALIFGQDYYIRSRFRGTALGPGPWSADIHIST